MHRRAAPPCFSTDPPLSLTDQPLIATDPTFGLIESQKIENRGAALVWTLHWFETELLTREENLMGLLTLNRDALAHVDSPAGSDHVVLDMDSSKNPVYRQQEGSADNGNNQMDAAHAKTDESPRTLLGIIALAVFVTEAFLMLVIRVASPKAARILSVLDAPILIVLLSPVLYFFVFRPLLWQITERRLAEQALQQAQNDLEARVKQRTADVATTNEMLRAENAERKRAEEVLQETESRLRTVLSNTPITIFATDSHGVFTLSEGKGLEHVGLKPGENVGVSALDLYGSFPFVEHTGNVTTGKDVLRRVLAGETVTAFTELRGISFENHIGPLRGTDGTVVGIVGVATDITERKRAEQLLAKQSRILESFFKHTQTGLVLLDRYFNFIRVNDAYARECQRDPSEFPGRNHFDLYPSELKEKFERVVRTNEGFRYSARPFTFPDHPEWGETYWDLALNPIVDAQGDVEYLVFSLNNVTDRKRAGDVLEQANDRLRHLSRRLLEIQETERRQLARELHDEIGQALTAAKINLQSLQRFPDLATLASRLDESVGIVERALQQVRSLSLELRPPLLDDMGLTAALRWMADQHARRAGLRLEFHGGPPDMRFEAAVETACFRIAQEALNNIVKHAGARNIAVNLQTQHDGLHLHVRDDGAGFDVAVARRRAAQGASLGLLGMEERAALAGGGIEWRSMPGQGAEVHAWFAMHRPTDTDRDTPATA